MKWICVQSINRRLLKQFVRFFKLLIIIFSIFNPVCFFKWVYVCHIFLCATWELCVFECFNPFGAVWRKSDCSLCPHSWLTFALGFDFQFELLWMFLLIDFSQTDLLVFGGQTSHFKTCFFFVVVVSFVKMFELKAEEKKWSVIRRWFISDLLLLACKKKCHSAFMLLRFWHFILLIVQQHTINVRRFLF